MTTKKSKDIPANPDFSNLSDDSLACLSELLKLVKLAQSGRLLGFAYAITYSVEEEGMAAWEADAVGSYRKYPMDAVATVNMLGHTVGQMVLEQAETQKQAQP